MNTRFIKLFGAVIFAVMVITASLGVFAANENDKTTVYVTDGKLGDKIRLVETNGINAASGFENGENIRWENVHIDTVGRERENEYGRYKITLNYATSHTNINFILVFMNTTFELKGAHPNPDGQTFADVEIGTTVERTFLSSPLTISAVGDKNTSGNLLDLHSITFTYIEPSTQEDYDNQYIRKDWGKTRIFLAGIFDGLKTDDGDWSGAAILLGGLGILGAIIGFIIIRSYFKFLSRKYGSIANKKITTLTLAVMGLYRFIGFLFPGLTKGWGYFSRINEFDLPIENSQQLMMQGLILVSPFLVMFFISAINRMGNIIHAVIVTVIMIAVTVFAGSVGEAIGALVMAVFLITLFMGGGIMGLRSGGGKTVGGTCSCGGSISSNGKCYSCGKQW